MTAEKNKDSRVDNSQEFNEEDPLSQNEKSKKKKSFKESVSSMFRNISVEPCVLLYILPSLITMLTTLNLVLEKACRVNLNYSKDICDSLKNRETLGLESYETAVQMLTAKSMPYKVILSATIPCLIAIYVGSFSDRTGHRKFFIICCTIGQIMLNFNNMFNVFFFYQLPVEFLFISEGLFEGLSGGWCIFFVAVFSHISAITNENNRTYRMGVVTFAVSLGFPLGMSLSGFLIKYGGYYASYGFAVCILTLSLIYTTFVLKEAPKTKEQLKNNDKGFRHTLSILFDFQNVRSTFGMFVTKGPRVFFLLVVACIIFGTMYGELSIMYLITRLRYNWNEVNYGLFQGYNFIVHSIGTVFSILVFSKCLQFHDSTLGIISTTSKLCSSFVYCFAVNATIFYLGPAAEILNGTALLATRSMLSKLVAPDEIGKVISVMSMSETLMPLLFVPLYSRVYGATIDWFPGFVFLVAFSLMLPCFLVFCWLFYDHRQSLRKQRTEQLQLKDCETANLHHEKSVPIS